MRRHVTPACCAAALLFCILLAGCGGQGEPQQIVMDYTDDELDAAWAGIWEGVDAVDSIEEKLAALTDFLEKFPQSHRTDNAVNVIFYFQGERMGDLDGAIDYVRGLRAKLTDPEVAYGVDLELLKAYARSGESEAFAELAEALKANQERIFDHSRAIAQAALELGQWQIALDYVDDGERYYNEESVLRENPDYDFGPGEVTETLNNRVGRFLFFRARAEVGLGQLDDALAHFTEAEDYIARNYADIPSYNLYAFWGEALLDAGDFDGAIEKLAPEALIMGNEAAMGGLLKAYTGKHGGGEGFDDFLRAEHPRYARLMDDFELPDYDGQRRSFAELKGEVTVITFWSPG